MFNLRDGWSNRQLLLFIYVVQIFQSSLCEFPHAFAAVARCAAPISLDGGVRRKSLSIASPPSEKQEMRRPPFASRRSVLATSWIVKTNFYFRYEQDTSIPVSHAQNYSFERGTITQCGSVSETPDAH